MQTKSDRLIPKLVKAVKDLSRKVDSGFKQVDQRFEQVDQRMATKDDLKELEARVIQRIEESEVITGKVFDETQKHIYQLATKAELARVASDVSDIKRRLIDVERDTPTRDEFEALRRIVVS
ncbi:MAG: hypothetical protein A2784_03815 [Candidatus Chisholmbacteria bacterium RIFCSPHIGHO2_01_FULL_48_12]|uniref:Uncharacterized protein n=1 Tax=Candidatus Chisholmbacteria bacterium RIFCSPHIGHO2_01_FULL_48_12 TaxID=1797589 RepID=A0A1G1VLG0_9BACT|nr:MAG: hypothetical protein A2784_03815 [Candidatus Chisholmbacteria bacterium RIFCSPHIGHO2_01_FULL_48_12]